MTEVSATLGEKPSAPHQFTHTVQIHDTDCYGVVWHGTYSRWLETGRVGLCTQLGIPTEKPGKATYLYPVVDQHLQFKGSATVGDGVVIYTSLALAGCRLLFTQQVLLDETLLVQATTTCVVVNNQWVVQRRMPDVVLKALDLLAQNQLQQNAFSPTILTVTNAV